MHQIRVALTQIPTMLRDILTDALAGQPDMVLVQEATSMDEADRAVREADIDVVITGLNAGSSRRWYESLLRRRPGLIVLSVPEDGSGVSGWTLRLHGESLGDVSTDGLMEAIRSAVRQPVGER